MIDLTHQPKHPLVAASILSADFGYMIKDCRDVLDKGADLLHIDVMDGHFVSNLTMGADMIRGLRKHLPDTFLDVHLMVEKPGDYVDAFAKAGANSFTFHVEVTTAMIEGGVESNQLIDRIRKAGMVAGMAINPPTSAAVMDPFVALVDLVLVMSVNPGRSGQSFITDVLDKTRRYKSMMPTTARLEMDGGVNTETVGECVAAGADMLVTASALFGAKDRQAVIDTFHQA